MTRRHTRGPPRRSTRSRWDGRLAGDRSWQDEPEVVPAVYACPLRLRQAGEELCDPGAGKLRRRVHGCPGSEHEGALSSPRMRQLQPRRVAGCALDLDEVDVEGA